MVRNFLLNIKTCIFNFFKGSQPETLGRKLKEELSNECVLSDCKTSINDTKASNPIDSSLLEEKEIFYKMFSPRGLALAQAYLDEEERMLRKNIIETPSFSQLSNAIVIGSGPLHYLDLTHSMGKNYIAVDKHLDVFINSHLSYIIDPVQKIELINKSFEDLSAQELPQNNSLFIFTFNVFSYMKNPLSSINRIIKEGDILFIAGWDKKAQEDMVKYLSCIFDNSPSSLEHIHSMCAIPQMDYSKILKARKIETFEGDFCQSVIIQT